MFSMFGETKASIKRGQRVRQCQTVASELAS